MKKCHVCGRSWPDNANFCSSCGTWLIEGFQPPPRAATKETGAAKAPKDKLEEGGLTTMEGVNLNQTQENAAGTGKPAGSEEEKPKKQKVWKRTKTGEIRMGFFRWLFLMILSILLCVVLLLPAVVYIVRDNSSQAALEETLGFVKVSSIKASDIVIGGSASQRFTDWLSDALYRSFGGRVDVSGRELQSVIEKSSFRPFVAGKLAQLCTDIYSFQVGAGATKAEFAAKLKENAGVFQSELNLTLTDELCEQLAAWFESAGFFEITSSRALNNEAPVVYFALHYALDWYAMIVYGVLALLLIIWMTAVGKSFLRTVKCFSVIAILIGLALCLGGLAAMYVPEVWELAFMGNYLLSALVGGVLYAHLLIPSSCILGGGILLRLLVALIRSVKISRRVRAATNAA